MLQLPPLPLEDWCHRTSYNDGYDTISWCTISWLFCLGGPKACQFDEGLFDTSRQPNVSLSPKYQSWIPKLPLDRRNSPKPSKTIHFVCLYFFVFFPLRPKMQFVFLYFFVFVQSFTDCTLSLLYFFRSLDMPSKNKTANPSMYVVFSFCWWFFLIIVVFLCNLELYFFVFLLYF